MDLAFDSLLTRREKRRSHGHFLSPTKISESLPPPRSPVSPYSKKQTYLLFSTYRQLQYSTPNAQFKVSLLIQRKREEAVPHRTMGPCQHSLEAIESLNVPPKKLDPTEFATFDERMQHLKRKENHRVCWGKSGIHGWGLFARRPIECGVMIIEYRGERIRCSVSDARETRYRAEKKDCYFFRISVCSQRGHSCRSKLTFDYNFNTDESDESGVKCLCQAQYPLHLRLFCLKGHCGFIVALFLSIQSIHVNSN